jgi:hypothetical protein
LFWSFNTQKQNQSFLYFSIFISSKDLTTKGNLI